MKRFYFFCVFSLLCLSAFAADPVEIKDRIAVLQAQHALIVYERSQRSSQDSTQDAQYAKVIAALQAQLSAPAPSASPSR